MHYYISHYTATSTIKSGELPRPEDIVARASLIRSMCIHAIYQGVDNKGSLSPVYLMKRELTQDECDILCLAPYNGILHEILP